MIILLARPPLPPAALASPASPGHSPVICGRVEILTLNPRGSGLDNSRGEMKAKTPAAEPALTPRPASAIRPSALKQAASKLIERHGVGHAPAIQRGVRQVAERWRDSD